jgi:single-strand DNA-binding protein
MPDATAVCRIRVAVNGRRKKGEGAYVDTEAEFYEITVWGQAALNVAESLAKGAAVIVAGPTWTESYTDRNGDHRTKRVIRTQHIGASLRFATVTVTRNGHTPRSTRPRTPSSPQQARQVDGSGRRPVLLDSFASTTRR